ncbi:MAG TPA: iron donor protein CyaY [Burkholderiaceae bacterium]
MSESEFLDAAEAALSAIEDELERAADADVVDVECSRSGNVLEVECIVDGSKIIINSQAPMQQLWIAARSGGFHYKYDDGKWINTRDGSEMYAALSKMVSEQAGGQLLLRP